MPPPTPQYDSVLLIDSDTAVAGDLAPLFSLPAEFAASWDQPKLFGRWGGTVWHDGNVEARVRPWAARYVASGSGG